MRLTGLYLPRWKICDCHTLVFNLRTYSSLGEDSTVTTYAAFQSGSKQLPIFQIQGKGFLDRCRDALGGKPLNSDIDPEFAKRFRLSSKTTLRNTDFSQAVSCGTYVSLPTISASNRVAIGSSCSVPAE